MNLDPSKSPSKSPSKTAKKPANRFTGKKVVEGKEAQNFRKGGINIKALQDNSNLSQHVDPNEIQPAIYQVRKKINPATWGAFVEDIGQFGVLQNLIVRRRDDGKLELVVGQRRQKAAIEAGLEQVPVVILEDLSNADALRVMMAENDQREEVNVLDRTEGILQLVIYELGVSSQDEAIEVIAAIKTGYKKVSKERQEELEAARLIIEGILDSHGEKVSLATFLQKKIPLLSLPPDVQDAIRDNGLSYTAATAIAEIKNAELRKKTLAIAIESDLSVRGVQSLVNETIGKIKKTRPSVTPSSDGNEPLPTSNTGNQGADQPGELATNGRSSDKPGELATSRQSSDQPGELATSGDIDQSTFTTNHTEDDQDLSGIDQSDQSQGDEQQTLTKGQLLANQLRDALMKVAEQVVTQLPSASEDMLNEAEVLQGFVSDFARLLKGEK